MQQTADVYYRKFKEPLPDLASPSPSLLAITVLEEHEFPEFGAVFRRRKLQFRYELWWEIVGCRESSILVG